MNVDPTVGSIAYKSEFSLEAVETMRRALAASGGRMAQFDHPEFGGVGQWMHGGMVMTSAGRDPVLEGRIDRLCEALDRAMDAETQPDEDPATRPAGIDPFVALEKLADLHVRGIVSDNEFAAKKAELLARI